MLAPDDPLRPILRAAGIRSLAAWGRRANVGRDLLKEMRRGTRAVTPTAAARLARAAGITIEMVPTLLVRAR